MNHTNNTAVAVKTKLKRQTRKLILTPAQKEILAGLKNDQKSISSKFFYDEKGSRLFEDICRLPEYYPTRTELSILEQIAPEIMEKYSYSHIVELGSGEALKIKTLFNALSAEQKSTLTYIPVDISRKALAESEKNLKKDFPEINIEPMIMDFMTQNLNLPEGDRRLICFFGSTLGNLDVEQSIDFLSNIAEAMSDQDHFLLGFDNIKSIDILEPAYDDASGVTAAFNKNILNVVNDKIGSDFNPELFAHKAFYNEDLYRIEMHLVAKEAHSVWIESVEKEIFFKEGEHIHTENSRKYTNDMIRNLAHKAGLRVRRWHTDPEEWFTVAELKRSF